MRVLDEDVARFDAWTGNRQLACLGTNSGAAPIAFQKWHRFKEAYAPELVHRAIAESKGAIQDCLDPFGGSGTTALACQFLGVNSTTVEVNPFLVDVIKAKVAPLDPDQLASGLDKIATKAATLRPVPAFCYRNLPRTFIEPGLSGRWLFSNGTAERIAALRNALQVLEDESHRRFFRVILGGLLVDVSNATVNGKGRRYRRNWQDRQVHPDRVESLFIERATSAIEEIREHSYRLLTESRVIHGDARQFRSHNKHDLSVFSPPYPNSFDYTDVYNIELWMLGYLTGSEDNRTLRNATLASHVQLHRTFRPAPAGSTVLDKTLNELETARDNLWNRWIPDMVGGYFSDLQTVLERVHGAMRPAGECWIVVGDSKYGGVLVPTARILQQLAPGAGWTCTGSQAFRSMRSSSQHGGINELPETLIVLRRIDSHLT